VSLIHVSGGPYEPIPFTRHREHEPGPLGIIPKRPSDFANGGVNAMLGINENVFAPEALDDFLPRD
jgi:hypothetical protein